MSINLSWMASQIAASQRASQKITKTLNEEILIELFSDYGTPVRVPGKINCWQIHINDINLLHIKQQAGYWEIKRGTTHKLLLRIDEPDMTKKLQQFINSCIGQK